MGFYALPLVAVSIVFAKAQAFVLYFFRFCEKSTKKAAGGSAPRPRAVKWRRASSGRRFWRQDLTAVRAPTFVQTQNDLSFVGFIRYCGLTEENFVKICSLLLFFVGYILRLEKKKKVSHLAYIRKKFYHRYACYITKNSRSKPFPHVSLY